MPIYKKISANIHELSIDNPETSEKKLVWIDVRSPGKKEITYLRKRFNFSLAHLQASSVKTVSQRPDVQKNDEYVFMILHFPIYKNGVITSSEINFFVGKDYLISLHNGEIETIKNFFSSSKKDCRSLKAYKTESTTVLLYEILEKIMLDCFKLLDKNSLAINKLEDEIFDQKTKKAVINILVLRRNIIDTRRIMQNHKNIFKKLINCHAGQTQEKDVNLYYNELLEHSKRFWEYLELQKEMIEVLSATNESLINYHISDIMKTLTIFSVIVFPLTLLAAIFGMNTMEGMPFVFTSYGFWIVIGIMIVGCLAMLAFFYKKNWL